MTLDAGDGTDATAVANSDGAIGVDVDVDADAKSASTPSRVVPDADIAVFLAAEDRARAALVEIAPEGSIGELIGHVATDDGAVLLQFACLDKAYVGWLWTAALGRASENDAPTVLEVELLPGDGALTSPEWRPWDERYAEYKAHLAEEAIDAEDDEDPDAEEADIADSDDVVDVADSEDVTDSEDALDAGDIDSSEPAEDGADTDAAIVDAERAEPVASTSSIDEQTGDAAGRGDVEHPAAQ